MAIFNAFLVWRRSVAGTKGLDRSAWNRARVCLVIRPKHGGGALSVEKAKTERKRSMRLRAGKTKRGGKQLILINSTH